MKRRLKRSPPANPVKPDLAVLVQTRVSKSAAGILKGKADHEAITVAAYVRRLVYSDLGILEPI